MQRRLWQVGIGNPVWSSSGGDVFAVRTVKTVRKRLRRGEMTYAPGLHVWSSRLMLLPRLSDVGRGGKLSVDMLCEALGHGTSMLGISSGNCTSADCGKIMGPGLLVSRDTRTFITKELGT